MIIEWNIDPEMINLFGRFSLRYYGMLFALGLLLGFYIVRRIWIKDGWSLEDFDKLSLYVFIATIVGARLGHCLFYEPAYYLAHPLEMILPFRFEDGGVEFTGFQGLASHGGILAVFLVIWWFSRTSKLPFFALLDKVTIGGALTAVFIRLANFMNSEIIGKATNADYGVIFKRVDNVVRHPSQLYEAFSYLVIFCIVYYLYHNRARRKDGFVFGVFFTLLFIARFLIEFSKENQVDFEDGMLFNMGQLLSIPFVLFGAAIMAITYRRTVQS